MLTFIISSCSLMGRKKIAGPKALTKLDNGETLINNQISVIKSEFPSSEIIVTTGMDTQKIIKNIKGVRIIENKEYKTTNCEDIRMAINASIGDEIVYISGDILFNKESLNIINGHSTLLVNNANKTLDDVGITIIDNHATILSYGVFPKWGKIAFFTRRDVDILKSILNNQKVDKLFFFEIINKLMNEEFRSIRAIEPQKAKVKVIL